MRIRSLPLSALAGLIVSLATAGCAGSGAGSSAAATGAGVDQVVLEEIAAGRWRATYQLARPADTLRFQRPATFYRERVWDVITEGYEFDRDGDYQILRLAAGASASDEIVVEFDEYTDQLSREYELFVSFSDGGKAVYTGHLYARPNAREMVRTVRLSPAPGENVVVRGGVHADPLVWTDDYADGTYVYYGSTIPLTTDEVIVVFDGGLPGWLREQFDEWLPRLFDLYRERMGAPLPWRPLVLYGHQASDQEGYSYGGGTLTGLIQLTVSGSAWTEPSETGRELALGFLAHEIAHLWNGQLSTNNGTDPWVHEGSADELADRLLFEFGAIDATALHERREAALNGCFLRLEGEGIKESQDPRTSYECGQVMAVWTEAAMRAAGSEADLFAFWEALIEESLRHEGVYDAERYLDVAASFGVPDAVRAEMDGVLHGENDPVWAIVAGLRAAGFTVRGGVPSTDHRHELARRAMGHVMAAACAGRFSFAGSRSFQTYAIEGCEPFEITRRVDRINGMDVATDGDAIYDSVADACAVAGRVTLASASPPGELEIDCALALSPRLPWYSITATATP